MPPFVCHPLLKISHVMIAIIIYPWEADGFPHKRAAEGFSVQIIDRALLL